MANLQAKLRKVILTDETLLSFCERKVKEKSKSIRNKGLTLVVKLGRKYSFGKVFWWQVRIILAYYINCERWQHPRREGSFLTFI